MPEAASAAPRVVRAGPATALLDGAFLRRIRVGRHEVLRGVYAAVRDQNWGTVEPTFSRYELEEGTDSFRLRFTAEHRRGDVDFAWDGEYVGEPSGRILFRFDGVCRGSFLKNRIGFCVLHPPELAGTPYTRETPAGSIDERFPLRISPSRDVSDMQALRYAVGGIGVELRFEGDLFDMEDQRNWTDASYKTFGTPLARPYPVRVQAGQPIRQVVTLDLRVPSGAGAANAVGGPDVVVGERAVGRLPPLGLGVSLDGPRLDPAAIEELRRLRLAHLRVEIDLRSDGWRGALERSGADSDALGTALEVAAVTDAEGSGLEELAAAVVGCGAVVPRLAAFAAGPWVTTPALLTRLRAAARAAGLAASVGGGSRADFFLLNSNAVQGAIRLAEMDFVGYAINPQVHTFDDLSIVETIGVQGETVATARELGGGRPVVVGPITLRPRYNAYASAPGDPPPAADPRQATPFAAAWTVGSLHQLARADAAALTYFETVGAGGILDPDGTPRPVHAVFADAADFVGGELLEVELGDPLAVEALALRQGGRARLLVANLTPEPRRAEVRFAGQIRSVELGPYGVARLDAGASPTG